MDEESKTSGSRPLPLREGELRGIKIRPEKVPPRPKGPAGTAPRPKPKER